MTRTLTPAALAAFILAAFLLGGCPSGPETMESKPDHGQKPKLSPQEEIRIASMKGREALRKGQKNDAIRWFTLVLSLDRNNYAAYTGRGQALFLMGQYAACLNDFNRALSLNRSDYRIWGYRGSAKYKINQSAEAIKDLTKAITMRSTAGWLYETRAKAYDAIGQIDNARRDRKKYQELGG